MSFFDWLVNHAEKSLDKENREYERIRNNERQMQRSQQAYNNSLECCANCEFLTAGTLYDNRMNSEYCYYCMKGNITFSIDQVRKNQHYTKTCYEFYRK